MEVTFIINWKRNMKTYEFNIVIETIVVQLHVEDIYRDNLYFI